MLKVLAGNVNFCVHVNEFCSLKIFSLICLSTIILLRSIKCSDEIDRSKIKYDNYTYHATAPDTVANEAHRHESVVVVVVAVCVVLVATASPSRTHNKVDNVEDDAESTCYDEQCTDDG